MGLRASSATRSGTATLPAPDGIAGWRDRLRAATYALYRRCRTHPAFPAEEEIEELVDLIDEGRAGPEAPASLTRVTAEALGGAILYELCRACRPSSPPESELVPSLMYVAVLPYAGPRAADEELRIPPPPR
jgi:hypothetical protein